MARAAAARGEDPQAALLREGARCSDSGILYLSPAQLAVVTEELTRMGAAMDPLAVEAAAFFLSDCLCRARVANNRVGAGRW